MKSALIIFVRNPVLGQVKTRLAKDIGDESALRVYIKLLEHTKTITQKLPHDVFVFYADFINENDLWNGSPFIKKLQPQGGLGERMQQAFEQLFDQGYEKLIIIGSDCYELTTGLIDLAFDHLNVFDTVIGPAVDGGYYLLGMRYLVPGIFVNKTWSTSKVYVETGQTIKEQKVSLQILPVLHDIDTAKDIKKYPGLL